MTQADNFWFGSDREELVVLNGGIRGFTVGSAHSSGRQSVGRGDCFSWRQAVDCSNLRRTPRCQPPASAPSDGPFSRSFKEGYSPILTSSIRHLCKAQHLSSQRILGSTRKWSNYKVLRRRLSSTRSRFSALRKLISVSLRWRLYRIIASNGRPQTVI